MPDWSIESSIDAWVKAQSNPELTFDLDSNGVFHEVQFQGTTMLKWMKVSTRRNVLLMDTSVREQAYLRQYLSNPSSVAQSTTRDGEVSFNLREFSDLDTMIRLLKSRIHGEHVVPGDQLVGPWSEFVYWAGRFHEWPEFDQHERDYKLKIATNLEQARLSLENGSDDWLKHLKRAFQSPNNLTSWRMHSEFLNWCQAEPDLARTSLALIWEPIEPRRIRAFLRLIPTSVVGGSGLRLSLASFLQMAIDPRAMPFYRATLFARGFELAGYEPPVPGTDEQGTYDHALVFLDFICQESGIRDLHLRDRLDAQSVLWTVAIWDPLESWSNQDQQRFNRYRGARLAE